MPNQCIIPDCDKPRYGHGYCNTHWARWYRWGSPFINKRDGIDPVARFWSKVEKTPTCWEWQGVINWAGYGRFWVNKRIVQAHRFSYELAYGTIPDGLTLDHLCSNRACVRPDHLEAVPIKTNVLRGTGLTAANAKKSRCPKGHPYDLLNTYVTPTGRRDCRLCRLEAGRRWWARTH